MKDSAIRTVEHVTMWPLKHSFHVSSLLKLLLITLPCALCDTEAMEFHKWTDSEGRVHYSDRIPGQDKKHAPKETIRRTPPHTEQKAPASENATSEYIEKERARRQQALEKKQRAAKDKREVVKARRQRDACDKARAVVRLLEENVNGIVRRRDERSPEVVSSRTLSKSDLRDEIGKWQKKVKINCPESEPSYYRSYSSKELPFSVQ